MYNVLSNVGLPGGGRSALKVTRISVPDDPGDVLLLTSILPFTPSDSTMFLMIARPRPVPARPESSCEYGWKREF